MKLSSVAGSPRSSAISLELHFYPAAYRSRGLPSQLISTNKSLRLKSVAIPKGSYDFLAIVVVSFFIQTYFLF